MSTRLEKENPLQLGQIYEFNWNEIVPIWKYPTKTEFIPSPDEIVSHLYPAETFIIVDFKFFDTEENFKSLIANLLRINKKINKPIHPFAKPLYSVKILGSDKMGWIYVGKQTERSPMWEIFRLVKSPID